MPFRYSSTATPTMSARRLTTLSCERAVRGKPSARSETIAVASPCRRAIAPCRNPGLERRGGRVIADKTYRDQPDARGRRWSSGSRRLEYHHGAWKIYVDLNRNGD